MSYVYDTPKGYELGTVSYGGLSRIEVSPEQKERQDKERKWQVSRIQTRHQAYEAAGS